MVLSELIAKLTALQATHGPDVSVMLTDTEGSGSQYSVNCVDIEVVTDEDSYPEEWNMPTGFTFVNITN
jgi:hypothetical protein